MLTLIVLGLAFLGGAFVESRSKFIDNLLKKLGV